MQDPGWTLPLAALTVAVTHTAIGPDHYLPFVMIGRARRWSMARTLFVTAICGLGHVGSSLLLGGLGIAIGMALGFENLRGDWAAWGLVAIGVAYALWGVRRARRHRHGLEPHSHGGHVHIHHGGEGHHHHHEHGHAHTPATKGPNVTFWALFLVFVLGPCEPLIPLMAVAGTEGGWPLILTISLAFTVATVATMMAITGVMYAGVSRLPLGPLERWSHAMAGSVVALSGVGILLGL
jgi:ABC-type nickel/cobalt efflux system permease component RcnA